MPGVLGHQGPFLRTEPWVWFDPAMSSRSWEKANTSGEFRGRRDSSDASSRQHPCAYLKVGCLVAWLLVLLPPTPGHDSRIGRSGQVGIDGRIAATLLLLAGGWSCIVLSPDERRHFQNACSWGISGSLASARVAHSLRCRCSAAVAKVHAATRSPVLCAPERQRHAVARTPEEHEGVQHLVLQ
jgi:hypothetical protein